MCIYTYRYIHIYIHIYSCRQEALIDMATKTVRLLDEKMESVTTRMVKQQKVCIYTYTYAYLKEIQIEGSIMY
jgi:hypothetical protein